MIETIALGLWWAIALLGAFVALLGTPIALIVKGTVPQQAMRAAAFSTGLIPLLSLWWFLSPA